jgi:hypothetical protein
MLTGAFRAIGPIRKLKASPEEIERFNKGCAKRKKWRDNNPEKVAEDLRRRAPEIKAWKENNPDAVTNHRKKQDTDKRHRPFVSIDAEGMDYAGEDIINNGVTYPKHRTFLWGAKGWNRKHAASVLEKDPSLSLVEGEDTQAHWLGTTDKRPLSSVEILEWLVSLPEKFGPESGYPDGVNFVSFSFGYDATQLCADIPYGKGRQIANRKEPGKPRRRSGYIFYKNFAIKYMKGKTLEIKRLRDEREPYKEWLEGGVVKKELDCDAYICIYDVFGFFQTSFVQAVKNLIKPGYIKEEDWQAVETMKKERDEFASVPFEEIKHYCELELTMLAKECTVLRDGFDKLPLGNGKHGIHLQRWSGSGSAAGAFLRAIDLPKKHYSPDIATNNISTQQLRAHHAFVGGRIELLRQGYAEDQPLWVYDIASAYPYICTQLPSMRDGTWEHGGELSFRELVDRTPSIISMFRVRWNFPLASIGRKPNLAIPFYPFPYRVRQKGLVQFPSSGHAWLMRDELMAGMDWHQTFFPGKQLALHMTIEEYSIFHPGNDEKPYDFLPKLYEMRKELKKLGDILEKCIKLVINSLYGKTVQSVGEPGEVPSCACPYYGAAITAGCRAQLLRAALKDPYAIVSFMTDGIVSTRPLKLGERLKECDAADVQLGDWEYKEVKSGFFLQSGIYSYIVTKEGINGDLENMTLSRSRGFNAYHITLGKDLMYFFLESVLPLWVKPVPKVDGKFVPPPLFYEMKRYITLGEATSSATRYRLIGRWAKVPREIGIVKPGPKREMDDWHPWTYVMSDDEAKKMTDEKARACLDDLHPWLDGRFNEAVACLVDGKPLRCKFLIPTFPIANETPKKLSAPSIPNWIEDIEKPDGEDNENPNDFGFTIENEQDLSDIGAGFQ